jgi:hypothetical protein
VREFCVVSTFEEPVPLYCRYLIFLSPFYSSLSPYSFLYLTISFMATYKLNFNCKLPKTYPHNTTHHLPLIPLHHTLLATPLHKHSWSCTCTRRNNARARNSPTISQALCAHIPRVYATHVHLTQYTLVISLSCEEKIVSPCTTNSTRNNHYASTHSAARAHATHHIYITHPPHDSNKQCRK